MWSSIVLSFKSQELQRPSHHAWIGCTGGGVSGMDSRSLNRKTRLRPRREFRGLASCDLVRERDSVGRIRTEVGMQASKYLNMAAISEAPGKKVAKTSAGTCVNENVCPCRFSVATISLKLMKSPTS